jgi:hypothetical protein
MLKQIIYLVTIFTLAFTCWPALRVDARQVTQPEQNSGAIVCAPGVYLTPPEDCLPLGPSEYLTEMARLGMTIPLKPLAVSTPDASLNNLPYRYYKVNASGTSFYPSLDAAIAKQGASSSLAPGRTLYVTYLEAVDTGKGIYFRMPSGEWMPGDGSRVGVGPIFQGLEFSLTPPNAFGWAWDGTEIRSQPSYAKNVVIGELRQYDEVQVYATQTVEGTEWNLIGPDQWVEARKMAVVSPNTTPPDGVTNGRWIDVDLAEQTLAVYDNQQLVFATFVATGSEPYWTRPGLFQIYKKKELENMSGAFEANRSDYYYLENVPWTMYFDKARALHGAYWNPKLGYPQSHGCVNLSIGDSHWLFNWAKEGDWVYVHDPSGLTPTDPAKYGEGGA